MSEADETRSPIEQAILDAMAAGDFDNLPGYGKPLRLEDDSMVPEAQRLANKLLRDNDLAPAWVMERAELRAEAAKLHDALVRAHRAYSSALAATTDDPLRRAHADQQWQAARQSLSTRAATLNRKLLVHNLRVPPAVGQLPLFDVARALAALGG